MEDEEEWERKVKKINNHIIFMPREIITILYFHNLEWVALIVEESYSIIKKEYQIIIIIITTYSGLVTVLISNDYELRSRAEGHQLNLKMILQKCIIGTD